MKELSVFLFIFSFGLFPKNKEDKSIVVLFYQQDVLTSVGINQQEFWSYRNQFDTIEIKSQRLKLKIKRKLLDFELIESDDINYQAAIIIPTMKSQKDTIYADRFFQYWKIHDKIYVDKSKFFEKLFVNFFDEQLN